MVAAGWSEAQKRAYVKRLVISSTATTALCDLALRQLTQPSPRKRPRTVETEAAVGRTPEIDPIIRGLLARLPKSGDVWSEADRKLWLNLLEGSFKLIYKDKDAPPSDGQHEAER
jgi:hypothetical protein